MTFQGTGEIPRQAGRTTNPTEKQTSEKTVGAAPGNPRPFERRERDPHCPWDHREPATGRGDPRTRYAEVAIQGPQGLEEYSFLEAVDYGIIPPPEIMSFKQWVMWRPKNGRHPHPVNHYRLSRSEYHHLEYALYERMMLHFHGALQLPS